MLINSSPDLPFHALINHCDSFDEAVYCIWERINRANPMPSGEDRIGMYNAERRIIDDERLSEFESLIHARDDRGLTALHAAAAVGDTCVVDKLVRLRVPFNIYTLGTRKTPFEIATESKQEGVMQYLDRIKQLRIQIKLHRCGRRELEQALKDGVPVDNVDRERNTLLHLAVISHEESAVQNPSDPAVSESGIDDIGCVLSLLQAGADLNAKNTEGHTALAIASYHGNLPAVKLLLEQPKIIIDVTDGDGRSALFHAIEAGELPVVNLLLEHGASPQLKDNYGMTMLHVAAYSTEPTMITKILSLIPSEINYQSNSGDTPLHFAASRGTFEAVEQLLLRGARSDVNYDDKDPYDVARENSQIEKALLLAHDYDRKYCPLRFAVQDGDIAALADIVSTQRVPIACVDRHEKRSVLIWAIFYEQNTVIDWLKSLDGGDELRGLIWSTDRAGLTAFHWAAIRGDVSLMKVFVAFEASELIGAPDGVSGDTPLHLASLMAKKGAVEFLLSYNGVLVESLNYYGQTPLHFAASSPSQSAAEVIEILMKKNAHVNCQDHDKKTPLHFAVITGNLRSIQVLLNADANAGLQDIDDLTALDLAVYSGNNDAIALLT